MGSKHKAERPTKGRKLGERYPCSLCGELFVMSHPCQHVCKKPECKEKLFVTSRQDRKKTPGYKKWASAYGKEWYRNGGKEWLKKWGDDHRGWLNERQRMKRYGRHINKDGARAEALKLGFKSMPEAKLFEDMQQLGVGILYEPEVIHYSIGHQTYTPDFRVFRQDGSAFYVEVKGFLRQEDRRKMKCIKEQYPDMDIRFVFNKASKPITKKSKTTYAMWAERHGFKWAENEIPDEWLDEGDPT